MVALPSDGLTEWVSSAAGAWAPRSAGTCSTRARRSRCTTRPRRRAALVERGAAECAAGEGVAASPISSWSSSSTTPRCAKPSRPVSRRRGRGGDRNLRAVRPDTCRAFLVRGRERRRAGWSTARSSAASAAPRKASSSSTAAPRRCDRRVREACAPFTEAGGACGRIGAGQVAKTANNILLWANIRADVEALRLGRALGVEPAQPVLRWRSAAAPTVRSPSGARPAALAAQGSRGRARGRERGRSRDAAGAALAELMQELTRRGPARPEVIWSDLHAEDGDQPAADGNRARVRPAATCSGTTGFPPSSPKSCRRTTRRRSG